MLTIDGYTVDAELSGEPTYESEMTTFPIERVGNGPSNMNEHVKLNPIGFSCEGVVSDSPLGNVRLQREIDGELGGNGPSQGAHKFLVALWESKQPVTVTCALGTFDNMVLLNYTPRKRGAAIQFTARFMLAVFVDNERTFVKVAMPRGMGTSKKKLSADPFEGPAMWRTTNYREWVASGRTISKIQERVGRIRQPKGNWLWSHADGVTPLSAEDAELWELEQRDAFNAETPPPGYAVGKTPGQLEQIPYDPFNPNASASAQHLDSGAYFSPTQQQWVNKDGIPIVTDTSTAGEQWSRFADEQETKNAYRDAGRTGNGVIDESAIIPE